jgi:chemotaxis methyl-accepting protein methylase
MQVQRAATMADYLAILRENAQEAQALFADLLISVTTFFRDSAAFEKLAALVIPRLFEDKGAADTIRVWIPGCATGEEAYSIAMLLLEEASRHDIRCEIQVFASDLDDGALAVGREGRYPLAIEPDMTEERLRRFFTREGDQFRVTRELRDIVLFARHSLLKDPPFSRVDLVSCRNVLIYLDRELQQQVCATFPFRLEILWLSLPWLFGKRRQSGRHVPRPRSRSAHLSTHADADRGARHASGRAGNVWSGALASPGASAVPSAKRSWNPSRGAGAACAAKRRRR